MSLTDGQLAIAIGEIAYTTQYAIHNDFIPGMKGMPYPLLEATDHIDTLASCSFSTTQTLDITKIPKIVRKLGYFLSL